MITKIGLILLLVLAAGCVGNVKAQSKTVELLATYDLGHDGQSAYVWYARDFNVTCVETTHSHAVSCLPGRLEVMNP